MPKLKYLDPESRQTLREAIAELRFAEGPQGDAAVTVAADLLKDIDIHDAIHVLFGCPTHLAGEIVAHIWTLLGTTVSMRDMHRVNEHRDHRLVLRQIGHARLLGAWLRNASSILKAAFYARRMRSRWPAENVESFLDRPLIEIRQTYGIRLVKLKETSRGSQGAALRTVSNRLTRVEAR